MTPRTAASTRWVWGFVTALALAVAVYAGLV